MSSLILHRFVSILIFPVFRKYFNFDIKIKIKYVISIYEGHPQHVIDCVTNWVFDRTELSNKIIFEMRPNVTYNTRVKIEYFGGKSLKFK